MGDVVKHQRIQINGIWMLVAEEGRGPLVLLNHGVPEICYCWRHQISFLASHGYHVIAPDLRGYGDSESPPSLDSYTLFHIVGGEKQAFMVGIDWGAVAGWHMSLFRPDKVKGLVALAVPYFPRSPQTKSVEAIKQTVGDGSHVVQFQEPGRAEKACAKYDYAIVLKKWLLITKKESLSAPGDANGAATMDNQ